MDMNGNKMNPAYLKAVLVYITIGLEKKLLLHGGNMGDKQKAGLFSSLNVKKTM